MITLDTEQLRQVLNARALGVWKREGDALILLNFRPAEDLEPEVAKLFPLATRAVSLDLTSLGIVAAALSGEPAISVASTLNPEIGSGYWLREFGADRSVAVPVVDQGQVTGVVSVAISGHDRSDADVIELIRAFVGNPS